MRTILTSNELHRLRHIVAEQANDAQAGGQTDYLHLDRLDAQDVADALEELVALRMQEEDAARHDETKRTRIARRLARVEEHLGTVEGAIANVDQELDSVALEWYE